MVRVPNQDFPESLHLIRDPASGLDGLIAIHSSARGPAIGGCRLSTLGRAEDRVALGLRLARATSYTCALAELPFGGGQAILASPEDRFERRSLFEAFGVAVNGLDGRFIAGHDIGLRPADMRSIYRGTDFVTGLDPQEGRAGGDPSPWTALGVFQAMKAVTADRFGLEIAKARVAVQGLGGVGLALCRLLRREGAELVVADADEALAARTARLLGAAYTSSDAILAQPCDVLAPCAQGGVLNDTTIAHLQTRLVCGGASAVLETDRHAEMLRARGIAYAPDFVVNAGGTITLCAEYLGEDVRQVQARVQRIAPRLLAIFDEADAHGLSPETVAQQQARCTLAHNPREFA